MNLELLRRQTEILNKNISLVTDDELGARLAKRVGINVQKQNIEKLTPVAGVQADDENSLNQASVKIVEPKENLLDKNKAEAIYQKPKYSTRRVALADIVSQRQVRRPINPKADLYRRKGPEKSFYFGSYTVDPKKIKPQKIDEKLTREVMYEL